MAFTLYVDESGEAGIGKIRSENEGGASPYFVMGGVLTTPTSAALWGKLTK